MANFKNEKVKDFLNELIKVEQQKTDEALQKYFEGLTRTLFNKIDILAGNDTYSLAEIEFYYRNGIFKNEQYEIRFLFLYKALFLAESQEILLQCTTRQKKGFMITDEQTNKVYFSSWLPQTCPKLWTELQIVLRDNKVDTALLNCTNDIWCRDFMPIQIAPDKMVFYDYNPDYLQRKKKYITNTKMLASMFIRVMPKVSIKYLKLIIDGGNIVKCGDTIVMTEKVFHENKEYSREDIVDMLHYAFECDIMFLPWDRSEPYGHSDGIIHYLGDNKVLLTNYDDFDSDYYQQFKIILEQKFEVIPLQYHLKEKHIDNLVLHQLSAYW